MSTQDNRPLSPHLEIYRWEFSNTMSMLHRATGVALSVGLIFIAFWLMAMAGGPDAFASSTWIWLMTSWVGYAGWFVWSLALFYHLCNGIRHLMWDAGYGFEIEQAKQSAKHVQITAVALTLITWLLAIIF